MPQHKLIYYDARGEAELTRWIFAYGGIDYVDDRIKKEDWPERQKTIFTGKVPVLVVDGKQLPGSTAIACYAARLTGLVPEDNLDAAFCVSVSDTLRDIIIEDYKIWSSDKPEENKKDFEDTFYPNTLQPFLKRLDNFLNGKKWFAGNKMTWADLYISVVLGGLLLKREPKILEPYPNALAITQKVREIPSIKHWIETSPQTPF